MHNEETNLAIRKFGALIARVAWKISLIIDVERSMRFFFSLFHILINSYFR